MMEFVLFHSQNIAAVDMGRQPVMVDTFGNVRFHDFLCNPD
jgi:hypothetical protein